MKGEKKILYYPQEGVKKPSDLPFTLKGESGKPHLILLHGSMSTPINSLKLAKELGALGYSIHAPILKGHGMGTTPQATSIELIGQVCDWLDLARKSHKDKVVLIGNSLGGTLALLSGNFPRPPDAIVSISGALKPYHGSQNPWTLVINDLKEKLLQGLRLIKTPTLFLHDRDDLSVSFQDSQRMFEEASSLQKKLILFKGSGHSLGFSNLTPEIGRDIHTFLDHLKTEVEVELTFEGEAHRVFVAGEFNNWDGTSMELNPMGRGIFSIKFVCLPGGYPYKFVVDGKWVLDPKGEKCGAPNGEFNSWLRVPNRSLF